VGGGRARADRVLAGRASACEHGPEHVALRVIFFFPSASMQQGIQKYALSAVKSDAPRPACVQPSSSSARCCNSLLLPLLPLVHFSLCFPLP